MRLSFKLISPALFFGALILFYPMIYPRLFVTVSLPHFYKLFTPQLVGMLCLGLCLLDAERCARIFHQAKYILLCALIFLLVSLIHFFTYGGMTAESFFSGMLWIIIPLFVYVYSKGIKKLLPYFIWLLWALVMIQTVQEYAFGVKIHYGVPGNSNWNAALALSSSLYVAAGIIIFLRSRPMIKASVVYFCGVVPIVCGLVVAWLCGSKGALLAFMVCAVIFAGCELKGKIRKFYFASVLVFAAGVFVAVLMYHERIAGHVLPDDVRLDLWRGAISLIGDNWYAGTSPAGFESVYSKYVPESYYLKIFSASRNNHPHNHYLYIFASMGVIAGIVWFIMTIYPLVLYLLRYRGGVDKDLFRKTGMFCYLLLLLHGMLDLVLFEWPGTYIFLMLLGMLWADTWRKHDAPREQISRSLKYACAVAGIALLSYMAVILWRNSCSSWNFRKALITFDQGDYDRAAVFFDRAVRIKPEPYYVFRAGHNLFYKLRDYDRAYAVLSLMDPELNRNYGHNNLICGQALMLKGHPARAREYLIRETRNFPIGVSGHFYLHVVNQQLGRADESERSLDMVRHSLRAKGMDFRHLQFLLANPYYDDKWHGALDVLSRKKKEAKQ
jgi:O-antigen ligase